MPRRREPAASPNVNESRPTTIQDLLGVLRTQHLVVLIAVVVSVAAALGFALSQAERYRATASLAFEDLSEDLALIGVVGGPSETRSSLTLRKSETVLGPEVLERAAARLRPRPSIAQLGRRVTARAEATSNLVLLEATMPTGAAAATTANAVARAAVAQETRNTRTRFSAGARELQKRYDSLPLNERTDLGTRTLYRDRISRLDALAGLAAPVRIAESAQAPDAPFSPKPVRAGIVAGIVGLFLGLGLAFLRNSMDRRVHGADEIRSLLDLPLLARVREQAMGKAGTADASAEPLMDVDLEAFRILRANLEFLRPRDGAINTVLVTSPLPEEGKSTVAASLAFASGISGKRTLLVECDLRRPSLAARLGLNRSPGLVELMTGEATTESVLRSIPKLRSPSSNGASDGPSGTLDCVLAGRATSEPASLLGSEGFQAFIRDIRSSYDVVIFDSAPLLPVVDTLELFGSADATILCIRSGRTTRDQACHARELLANTRGPVALVVTGVQHQTSGYDYPYAYPYESKSVPSGAS